MKNLKPEPRPIERALNARNILSREKWLDSAFDLIVAAHAIMPLVEEFWKDPKVSGKRNLTLVYFMLVGLAMENLTKAHLASKISEEKQEEIYKEGKVPKIFKRHFGEKLLEQAEIKIHKNEKHLIERIERAVVWAGRYPSSITPAGSFISTQSSMSVSDSSSSDLQLTKDLLSRVHNQVTGMESM